MVTANAVLHGDREYLIGFDTAEHPVALQIGGSDPAKLAEASKIGEGFGYDEININIGCPSDRVQSGRFGACLMQEPDVVAECYAAMAKAVDIPVTVKCRLGVDDQNIDETLPNFLEAVSAAGCSHFIIHARKAWLKGLSPKENRNIPPLMQGKVREMKHRFPQLQIVLNGGLGKIPMALETTTHEDGRQAALDGFMLGRAAYNIPWYLTEIDSVVFKDAAFSKTREDIVTDLIEYARCKQETDRSTKALIRHIMGLFFEQPGARLWRRTLSEGLASGAQPSDIIIAAYEAMHRARKAA